MRKIAAVLVLIGALALYVGLCGADSYAVGKMNLSGPVLEIDNDGITASGGANFVSTVTTGPMKPGTMRVDSLRAEKIRLDLARDKKGRQALKQATATGNVVIKGKRAEQSADEAGKPITTIQDFVATADNVNMPEGQDIVVLTGNVLVKVTEPGVPEPIWTLDGKKATFSLKDNKMRIEGDAGKPAALTVTPKEEKSK